MATTCVAPPRPLSSRIRRAPVATSTSPDCAPSAASPTTTTTSMGNLTKEEFVHVLRRQSTGFPRGSSKYRGVTPAKVRQVEAQMGQFLGKKNSLGEAHTPVLRCASDEPPLGFVVRFSARSSDL